MADIFSSVRRSLVYRNQEGDEKGSPIRGFRDSLRRSRIGFPPKSPPRQLPSFRDAAAAPIRWRKGELIGAGAYGRVYMGMNIDSGELLAVKQVLIAANSGSKEKAQAHVRELEEEVRLLKNLSHQNIVRYLGTAREEEALNILLEFVPGGSISSLLGKFGSFPEPVIRMYTKQLLQGLEYLHRNGIIHRDIKGANILVDNKGCIKLADFGASKKVVELATSGAKSMKGTPYWMAPEVIRQTGHSFSADIWSVGCTVIEMATGKPPWSEKYQEVAALFHIGTTKSHPPIPEHLSIEAQDFLLKCLQKEADSRPSASELLRHPFVMGECLDQHPFTQNPISRVSVLEQSMNLLRQSGSFLKNSFSLMSRLNSSLDDVPNMGSVRTSGTFFDSSSRKEEDGSVRLHTSPAEKDPFTNSFNPMSEPFDDWSNDARNGSNEVNRNSVVCTSMDQSANFSFHGGQQTFEDDEEVTESKIRAFLDEKALELRKLQSPLYEEYYNTINSSSPGIVTSGYDATSTPSKKPPLSRSPSKVAGRDSAVVNDSGKSSMSPGSVSRRISSGSDIHNSSVLREVPSQKLNEGRGLVQDAHREPTSPRVSCYEQQKLWREELDRELERERERKKRMAANGGKESSPKDTPLNHQRDRIAYASP